jgi:hypothetical protein
VTLLLLVALAASPDVVVEGALGTLDSAAVQAEVQKSAGAVKACFDEHAPPRYVGGALHVRARVGKDGKVKKAFVAAGDLGAWGVERCLMKLARGMSFGRPTGGEAEVDLPFEFPPQGTAADAGEDAALDGKLAALRSCGRAGLGTQVTLYVGAGGRVTSAGFAGDVSEAWGDCAAAKARGWRLADPLGRPKKVVGTVP